MDRQNAHWMKREDERILEFLEAYGLATPSLISEEAFRKVSPGHVGNGCSSFTTLVSSLSLGTTPTS